MSTDDDTEKYVAANINFCGYRDFTTTKTMLKIFMSIEIP